MKRIVALTLAAVLCLSLCACGRPELPVSETVPVSDPCEVFGHTMVDGQTCAKCGYTQPAEEPLEQLTEEVFGFTVREYTQRLKNMMQEVCPGVTVALVEDDWCVTTQLQYGQEVFCELTYYDHDGYLEMPFADDPMGADELDQVRIRHVNLLDFVDAPHPENGFAAIAMALDPLLTLDEANALAQLLKDTRREYYGNYLVTAVNGVGYGHGLMVNQMVNSGSIAIHAGSEAPELCVHIPEYFYSGDGVPSGYCTKCSAYVNPAGENWQYLTSMKMLSHSNNSSRSEDIVVGNWEDPVGAVYWNALRFWVAKQPGLTNSEYIEYALDGSYDTLSGSVVSWTDSDSEAVTRIEIWLDGELAFASGDIGYYDMENYTVDISGASVLKMVCITDTPVHGYCVVSAAMY